MGVWSHLQAPCWSLSGRSSVGTSLLHVGVGETLTHPLLESVSSVSWWAVSLTRPVLESVWMFVGLGISPTSSVLESVSSFGKWGVVLARPALVCPVVCQLGSFSHTPRAEICLVVWRMRSFPDTPRDGFYLVIQLVGSFSYTPRAVWLFVGLGASLTRPILESVWSLVM